MTNYDLKAQTKTFYMFGGHSAGNRWSLCPNLNLGVEDSQTLLLLRLFASGFPGGSASKDSTCNVGDLGLIPRLGRSPAEGNGYFPSMEFHGLYSPWGPKELDMTERLSLSLY